MPFAPFSWMWSIQGNRHYYMYTYYTLNLYLSIFTQHECIHMLINHYLCFYKVFNIYISFCRYHIGDVPHAFIHNYWLTISSFVSNFILCTILIGIGNFVIYFICVLFLKTFLLVSIIKKLSFDQFWHNFDVQVSEGKLQKNVWPMSMI